jgi:hypothetical protein
MQQQRAKLPMAGLRQQIAEALAGSDAVVISGETGSGKTTQVLLGARALNLDLLLWYGCLLSYVQLSVRFCIQVMLLHIQRIALFGR